MSCVRIAWRSETPVDMVTVKIDLITPMTLNTRSVPVALR
jgi:hypothetical protein